MTPLVAALLPHEFFEMIVYVGLIALIAIIIPVQIAAKYRRLRRKQTHIVCRICGYRFIKKDPVATCPTCASKNARA